MQLTSTMEVLKGALGLYVVVGTLRSATANPGLHSRWIYAAGDPSDIITPYNSHSYTDDLVRTVRLLENGCSDSAIKRCQQYAQLHTT